MNLQPLADRVVVQRFEFEKKSIAGAIYVPEGFVKPPDIGLVVAIGPGKRRNDGTRVPIGVSLGDTIVFDKHSGVGVKAADGVEYIVMREAEIFAVKTFEGDGNA